MSQLPPNPVQGGLSQFLSWIENNSHRLRLQKGKMENVAWISQTDLNWAGTCWNLKPVPGWPSQLKYQAWGRIGGLA